MVSGASSKTSTRFRGKTREEVKNLPFLVVNDTRLIPLFTT